MGVFKNMVCRGTFFYLSGVHDQRAWNDLMVNSFGVSVQPLLEDLWSWSSECAQRHNFRRKKFQNCWEVMRCGHGGGRCRASSDARLHGIHGGQNAGRACWAVPSTLCRDRTGSKCKECPFYEQVQKEQLDYLLDEKSLKVLLRRGDFSKDI